MSEADEIREALDALTEAVANERWSAWDRPEAVRLKALAQLDSLTTRLAEVTNRMHVLQAQLDDSATRLAEVERERDEARFGRDKVNAMLDDAEASERALREQLTQAREALEGLPEAVENDPECCHAGSPRGISDVHCYVPVPVVERIAAQALATINREGETAPQEGE